jgi:hypothetical protein
MRHILGFSTVLLVLAACSSGGGSTPSNETNPDAGPADDSGLAATGADSGSSSGGGSGSSSGTSSGSGSGSGSSSGSSSGGGSHDAGSMLGSDSGTHHEGGVAAGDGGTPTGWLYTSGGKIYVSTGTGGTPWMGRGVNVDDIFFCGYDDTLWMTSPGSSLQTLLDGLITSWKPSFIRMSLGMDSDPTVVSWLTDPAQYKTPMTTVIESIGTHAGVYVLVTLRSDASMIDEDTGSGDGEATGVPSDATTSPNTTQFPSGTDAVYTALVDSFANDAFVLFGLTNEPGGNTVSNSTLSAAMSHAVGTIRAEEDRLGVPHHIVSVQGNSWTSDISFYATSPLPYDNVVYEVHGYPPAASSYTYSNIPVIIGEYGSLTDSATFYADVESKQIPNLAWDFEPYSDCAPDLLNVNDSSTNLSPTSWGSTVQAYLAAHAQ